MWELLVSWISRLRFTLSRQRLNRETAEELRTHLELLTERYVDSGMTPAEARQAAARQLGNVTLVREDVHVMNSVQWLDVLINDLTYACRVVARNPAFALVVVATLALGIGANSAILSVAHAALLKPLPYERPGEIYGVQVVIPERAAFGTLPVTVQAYFEWRAAKTDFTAMGVVRPWEASVTGDGEPERLGGARVSANFFSLLGVPIARGREFSANEEQPGNENVVVLSDGLWRRRYAADEAVIGKTIMLNGRPHLVIGVAAPSLLVPTGTQLHALLPFAPRVEIWKPIAPTARELEGETWDHGMLARLSPAATPEQGRQQLERILNEMIRTRLPDVKTHLAIQLVSLREIYAGRIKLRLLLVLAASTLLLLTACASIANVLLARVASRANELATRIALGAGRGRIVSQILTEALVLAVLGGSIGAVIAVVGTRILAAYGPDDLRGYTDLPLNARSLGFALAVSVLTGLACGIVPAWQACRRDVVTHLRDGGRNSVGARDAGRARQILVGIEMSLATVLLASAGLLLHSFVRVMTTDRGYEVDRILAVELSLFGQRYSAAEARTAFYNDLLESVRALPRVAAAGAVSHLPALSVSDGGSQTVFYPTDTDFRNLVMARPVAVIRSATSGYFQASGVPLLAGRLLTDQEPAPVAVISASLASILWPGELPGAILNRQFRQGNTTGPLIEVVGVVTDARPGSLDREPPPVIYRPYRQWASGPMTVVVRASQDPTSLSVDVRAAIRRLDPNLPIASMRTLREILSSTVAPRRFQMTLMTLFAVVALLLGAVGTYGVVSYGVVCRTREVGLRMALGARRADVLQWVILTGLRPVLVGVATGLVAAIAAASAMRGMLFGVTPLDPLSLGVVVTVLVLTAALACYLPARRAARLDPIVALRHD